MPRPLPRLTRRGLSAGALVAALALAFLVPARASSHRESPLITEDPVADNTDLYAFVSPDRPDTVTLIANWIPLEEPAGGPNFYRFGDDVLYQLHVDTTGDAVSDVTYELRFRTQVQDPDTFLYATGPITWLDDPDYNVRQTYSVGVVRGGRRTVLGSGIPVPPNNVGPRSTPAYDQLAEAAVTTLPGDVQVFAGQRDDAFYVDLGAVFDLAGLRPFNPAHAVPLPAEAGKDAVAGFNVHTVALQVPIASLGLDPDQPVIGVWSSTARRHTRVFSGNGANLRHAGPWVQVSRLGLPLVNEVLIPLRDKDRFNANSPQRDAQFIDLVRFTTLDDAIAAVYPGAFSCFPDTAGPRDDLVTILLEGLPGINAVDGGAVADLLRLNTAIPPTQTDPNRQSSLGLLGGDRDGFPNGRRLVDDVVDIELRVVAGAVSKCPGATPNSSLGDGVNRNDRRLLTTFPYLPAPHGGYDNGHGRPETASPSSTPSTTPMAP